MEKSWEKWVSVDSVNTYLLTCSKSYEKSQKSYDSFLFVSSPWQGRVCKENASLQWELGVRFTSHERVW